MYLKNVTWDHSKNNVFYIQIGLYLLPKPFSCTGIHIIDGGVNWRLSLSELCNNASSYSSLNRYNFWLKTFRIGTG